MEDARVAILMSCHNRREKTLACLKALFAQDLSPGVRLQVYLVDDGSHDGTGEAVRAAYPEIRVLRGDGSLFWNGGTRLAFSEALSVGYAYYLWLNDDTVLDPEALDNLLRTYRDLAASHGPYQIVVGSTRDPATGVTTYGGVVRPSRWRPLKVRLVEPDEREPKRCDTINGNCVLIPRAVAERVGNLDGAFTHRMADHDYGLRARGLGCSVWIAPGHVGACPRNSPRGTWQDPSLPLLRRLKLVRTPLGLPPREWLVYARRYAGRLWPAYWAFPYLRFLASSILAGLRSHPNTDAPARRKVAILVNIIAPYRVPVYREIGRVFRTSVFYSGEERGRAAWEGVKKGLAGLAVEQSWGVTVNLPRMRGGKIYDYDHLHINPGYLWDLLRTRPDAVVTNEMGARTAMALLYGSLFRRPVWVWWGGTLHTERHVGRARRIVRGVISRWAKRWISYGETSTEYLLSLGVPRKRILQVQNCVDESLYLRPEEPTPRPNPEEPVLLYVGRLVGKKGLDRLLEAAGRVRREGYRFSLRLVGDGPARAELEGLARRVGLDGSVRFRGGRPPEEMPAVYRAADCLVFSTLQDVWGLVVNEALWSGLPVISSVYAGCARELLPEENLFDPLDQEGFAAEVRRAVRGELAPVDTGRLKTCAEVAGMIVEDIDRVLEER